MTQKELIDFCNTQEDCFAEKCPHLNGCERYLEKYDGVPYLDNEFYPSRYTDEEI